MCGGRPDAPCRSALMAIADEYQGGQQQVRGGAEEDPRILGEGQLGLT